ncbi:hypothetical protein Dsin_023994 [Dipteronia sinensis]|uniref:Uncharacterized protein n=1 Tax=Dipteronia sinensis TaxID=43782 RepID=A0AAE0A5X7_9ROSI|nr:hypothetical protein Dsin_023994 [Dipteronia sinensis]
MKASLNYVKSFLVYNLHYRNVMDFDHLLNYPSENDIVMESPTDEEIIQGSLFWLRTVKDLGTSDYHSIRAEVGRGVSYAELGFGTRSLIACGTSVDVGVFVNKFSRVFASTCLTAVDAFNARSIINCHVLVVSGMSTPKDSAIEFLNA